MSYILKDIFGDTARVRILEELAERWGEKLSADEIARMTDKTPKTIYNHLHELENIGIITSISGRPTKYGLNQDDERALAIAIIEDQEYLRKTQLSIDELETCENIVGSPLFSSDTNFGTPFDVNNIKLEGESK